LTDDNQALHEAANEQWPDGHGRYERLFAMGIDTYRLQGRLYCSTHCLPASCPASQAGYT
ncbi:hypothetical protein, partial [Alcanivorax sp.]|uniref:hypothetical protein n=1 Tax=Alcanivorax sp. TaxID=1872427 RepID=UPI002589DA1E